MENENYTQPNQEYEATPEAKPEKTKISGLRKALYGAAIVGALTATAVGTYAVHELNEIGQTTQGLEEAGKDVQSRTRNVIDTVVQDLVNPDK